MALPYHGDPNYLHTPMPLDAYRAAVRIAMQAVRIPVRYGLEIGLGWGASALTFLETFPEAKLFSADVNGWLPARKELEAKFPHRFQFVAPFDQGLWAKDIVQWLYIDGGHAYEEVKTDIEQYYPRLMKGGVLCFDDYDNLECPDVRKAVDEFAAKNEIKLINAGGPTGIVYYVKEK